MNEGKKELYLLYKYDKNPETEVILENKYIQSINILKRTNIWGIITFNNAYKLTINDKTELAHESLFMKKCFKFPFMKKGDIIIGPCLTLPNYRGQGLYPFAIKEIISWCKKMNIENNIYLVIAESNRSSRRGAEKAGFIIINIIIKTKILKIYKCIK